MKKSTEAENEKVDLKLRPETAVWLRRLLEGMQVNGQVKEVRRLLAYGDEVLAQLPGGDDEKA